MPMSKIENFERDFASRGIQSAQQLQTQWAKMVQKMAENKKDIQTFKSVKKLRSTLYYGLV